MFNIVIMVLYLGIIVYIGILFRKENNTPSSFLKAKGSLPWFWVGASAYISQFSAWTFTVGASEAYKNGYSIVIVFFANAISFLIAGLYFARKFRQLRVNNSIEVVSMRFGSKNATLTTIALIPNFLIFPAIWLYSLSVFISSALGIPIVIIIVGVGGITILMSVLGGAWAVVSSDFIQMIIVSMLALFTAIIAFIKFREIGGLFTALPLSQNIIHKGSTSTTLFILWVCYMILQKTLTTNSFNNIQRFSTVDNSRNASKAAFFAAGIYLVGTCIWFVPAWFISVQGLDLANLYPNLKNPSQAAYLAFIQHYMPVGVLGIAVVALFSATMSSIDSSLNWCSGFLMSVIKSRKKLIIGKFSSVLFGIIVIILTLYYNSLWNISFFDLTYKLITYIYVPLLIPLLLCNWLKKTPDWGYTVSIVVGLLLSWWLAKNGNTLVWTPLLRAYGILEPMRKDITNITLFGTFILQIIITGGIFTISTLFFKEYRGVRATEVSLFYRRLTRPVYTYNPRQIKMSSKMLSINRLSLLVAILVFEVMVFSQLFLVIPVAILTIVLYKIISHYHNRAGAGIKAS